MGRIANGHFHQSPEADRGNGGGGNRGDAAGTGFRASDTSGKKFKIALSNSYIGNKWRIEMENVFKAALLMEPFKSQVEGPWFNSGNDVSQAVPAAHQPDRRAGRCDLGRGGLADRAERHPQPGRRARHPGGILRQYRHHAEGAEGQHRPGGSSARPWLGWLVKQLNGKGNVIMVTGVAGTSVDWTVTRAPTTSGSRTPASRWSAAIPGCGIPRPPSGIRRRC